VQMIEDELLLEMPMFYRHDIDACGVKSSDELRGEQKTKPFAQLAELFKK
ncbi:MAG: 23S rRNA accumulation protein YceD, partial [Gammaproteobacteria bacterium]|nr:23S rRNA accumulation protein YceD [Gammaproteobacteria bacterium]